MCLSPSRWTFVVNESRKRVSAFTHTQLCCRDLEYTHSMGDRKGYLPSMSSMCGLAGCFNTEPLMDLHVRVCWFGMRCARWVCGFYACNHLLKSDICAFGHLCLQCRRMWVNCRCANPAHQIITRRSTWTAVCLRGTTGSW